MSMNIFRLCGDLLNVISHILLVTRLLSAKNAQALSLGTLELYLVVHLTRYLDLVVHLKRYLDLLTTYYSFYNYNYLMKVYNSLMKIFYVTIEVASIALIRCYGPLRTNRDIDKVPYWRFCAVPCLVVTIAIACSDDLMALCRVYYYHYLGPLEFCWTFSILLESIAMIPQLVLLKQYQKIECLSGCYMASRSIYRMMYVFNWIFRAYHEPYYQHHVLVYFCAAVQSLWGLCVLVELWQKGWEPRDLFVGATYSQPRLSRLKEENEEDVLEQDDRAKQDVSRRVPVREQKSTEAVVENPSTSESSLSEPLLQIV